MSIAMGRLQQRKETLCYLALISRISSLLIAFIIIYGYRLGKDVNAVDISCGDKSAR